MSIHIGVVGGVTGTRQEMEENGIAPSAGENGIAPSRMPRERLAGSWLKALDLLNFRVVATSIHASIISFDLNGIHLEKKHLQKNQFLYLRVPDADLLSKSLMVSWCFTRSHLLITNMRSRLCYLVTFGKLLNLAEPRFALV